MAYTPIDFKNLPNTSTPLNAARLNHMQTQYSEAVALSEAGLEGKADLENGVVPESQLPTGFTPPSGVFPVESFGAVGDGESDDKVAFQLALDAAFSAGGGEVVAAPGKSYLIGSGIIIRENVTFTAYGASITKKSNPYSWFRNFDKAVDSFPGYTGNGNILIRGGTWYGNSGAHTEASGNVITLAHCENVEVRDVIFIDVSAAAHAVEFNAVRNGRIVNCHAYGYQSLGGASEKSEAFQIDLASATTWVCAPADDTTCRDILIQGCSSGASDTLGVWGCTIGSHSMSPGKFHENIRITGNVSNGSIQEGIRLYQYKGSLVQGNVIRDAGTYGINSIVASATAGSSTDGSIISGNVIEGGTWGIQSSGNTSGASMLSDVISGNKVTGCSSWGIRAINAQSTLISGNSLRGCDGHGILTASSSLVVIASNQVSNCTGYGVILSPDAVDCLVRDNLVSKPGSGAFRVSSNSSRNSFIGNAARLEGAATSSGLALSVTANCTGTYHFGNDFSGFGAAGVSDAGTASVTSPQNRV